MGRGKFIWRRKLIALRKLFALVLCFSFILTPLEVAFAQDAGTGTAATDSGSSTPPPTPPPTPTPPPSPDFSIPGVDATPPSPDGSASGSAPSTDASPATEPVTTSPTDASTPSDSTQSPSTTPPPAPLSPSGFGSDGSPTSLNPNVFTAQNTAPKADGATGALTQTIPLDIPPGRNGVQPDLALKYNSQNTEDGIAGYGWTVSIPYIQRLNKIGSQSLYNAPYFTSSIDGELATTSSATTTMTFDAKVDDGSFNSYSFANNVWTMYDKNGTRYTFGASDNAQQNASASSTQIYKWMLQEIRDTNNNYVRYTYFKDSGQIYPMQIYYTGNGGTDGTFQVTFAVASRGDVYINYTPGFKVTTNYRVAQIEVRSNGNEVRRYYLSYTTGKNVLRSLLSGVQEIGWDANHANQVSYPALSLGYVSSSAAFAGPHGAAGQAYITGDANGDGLNDVMVSYTLIGGGQTAAVNGTTVSAPEYWGSQENVCPNPYPSERGVRVLDTNADGKMDIFRGEYNYTTGVSILDAAMNTYSTSTGYGWSGVATDSVPYFDNDGSGSVYHVTSGIFGDVNGDGLPDYEEAVSGLGAPFGDYAYLGNGFEWGAATTTIFAPKREMPTGTATYDNSQLVDINGDGLSDWVYSDSSQTYVVLNTGTGWESSPSSQWTLSTSTLYTNYSDRGMRFIDINGDGLPDFVRSYSMGHPNAGFGGGYEEGTYQVVFLNTGLGWATSTAYTLAPIATIRMDSGVALGECYDEYANMTGNGQNAQDVLSTITYPQGGSATVSYVKTAQSGNPELPYSLLVVSSIISNDGFGNTVEKDYSYTGGKQYTALGVRNRKFAGFANSTESDANTLTTTYYDQGDTINTSLGEQNDGYGQINHPFRIDVAKKSNGQLMRQTFDRWDATSTFIGNTTFVQLARQVVQDYGPSGDHRDTATDYTYSTSTGNVTQIARYGEVAGNSDGTFSDINNDGSVTTNTYAHSTSTNLNVLIEKVTGPAIFASSSTSTLWTLANVLVVGGGGGGGAGFNNGRGGGAGGGGGVDLDPVHPVSIQSYSITVGAGGAGSTDSNFAGSSGSNSVFDTITAYGGGGGGSDWQGPSSGGSGGGGDASGSSGGSGTVGQGYAGGTKASGDSGAGGGGATQIGQVTTTGVGGAGGTGYTTSISGTSATYGGGGGGGGHDGGGAGGTGGGGAGGQAGVGTGGGTAGTANTGGGGGGGKWYNGGTTGPGGTGGLGIVIIAAPIGVVTSASGGTHTTANGNDIWKFTSSGTWTINSLAPTNSTSTVMTATSSDTRLYYDSLPFGQVSLGDNTKQENWIAGSTYASTTRAYDGTYGLVTGSTDADGNLSTSTLDINHLYAATTTNPFFQATGYTYDYSTGKVTATYDPNNRLYTTSYDGFGRPLTSSIPEPATGALATKTTYSYTDSSTPGSTSVTQTNYLNAATSSVSYTYFDGLNRKLQSRRQAQNSNYAVKDWTYNNVGLLNTESLPYFATGSSHASATTSSTLFTTYGYDALQRVTSISNSVGNTTNAYDAWTVTTTDPNGKVKDYTKDAYGNLATVVEHISGSLAYTTYAYDLNKNLTKMTDSLGNIRNFTYDGVGNKLTAQDLHAATDTSFGITTSAYDAAGNITQSVDAKNQTVNYTYDALNRPRTEDYTGSAGTDVSYAYDACQDGKGRLCAATTTDAVTNLTYNPDGAVASEKKTINGTAYTTSFNYDRQGNVTDMTYPDTSVVKYGYDNNAFLNTISRKAPGGTKYVNAVQSIQYSPNGSVSTILYGDGVTTNKVYDSSQLYRIIHINSVASTTQITSGGGSLGAAQNALSKFALVTPKATDVATKVASDVKSLQRAEAEPIAVSAAPVTLNTSTGTLITTSIVDMIAGKSAKERADIKGQQIANIGQIARVTRGDYDIQVVSMMPIDGGVAVFARVWGKDGQQIGFGRDGSVDIERFLIHNPPVLVPDATGSIARTWFNKATGATTTTRFREDAREALLQTLEQIISVKKLKFSPDKIIPGKVGNTTSTFYPDATPEVSSVDGSAWRNVGPTGEPFTTIIYGVGTNSDHSAQSSDWEINAGWNSNTFTQVVRSIFVFDTSALPDGDFIDAGTLSLYGTGFGTTYLPDATTGIYGVTTASTTAIVPSDYQGFASTTYSNTTFSTSTFSTTAYNNFPLNVGGVAAVSKTGATKIGFRNANYDAAGVAPAWPGIAAGMSFGVYNADSAGTTVDPMLVVEHSADATTTGSGDLQDKAYGYNADGNITNIKDTSNNNAAAYISFTYDDVNRLTNASTTIASTTPYSQTYTYNSIGDITNKSDVGSYTYAGTGDANPHAPTTVNGVTYTYDNNGNLTSAGSQKYTWDYRNRITSVGNGAATSTYGYDYLNQRVRKVFGTATTTYPNKYMSKSAATTTDYIYMGDTIIAEVEVASTTSSGGGGSISTSTIAFDATSTSVTTTSSGNITKTWTHTVTGTNPVIVLTADLQQTATGTGSIASATWNGGAFTKATSTRTNAMESEVWYLVATTTGSKTMSVTINGSTTAIRLGASSFTGVSPTWPLDVVKSANGNGGNPSISVTPTIPTDVVVSTLSKYGGGGGGGGTSTSTPALVQSTFAPVANSVSFSSPVTSGNLVVVGITEFGQTLAANDITDNKSNTYTKIAEAINGSDHAAIYYAKNVTGGSSFTVSSVDDGTIAIHEYSGIATSSPLNATSTKTGTSNSPTSGIATSTVGNDLFFSVAWSNNSGDSWTAGNGYTLRQQETDNNTDERLATEDQVLSSASTSAAWYKTTTSDLYAAAVAAFKPQVTTTGGGSATSPDATSSQTTLWKDSAVATFGGASYKIATTSGAITDTYTTAASQDWVMAAIALRPATSTSSSGGTATTTRYFLPDHLNSTNVVTDASGTPVETLDYYPYGSTRVSQQTNGYNEAKQYVGQYEDPETNLSYLQARYMDGSKGQFLSEDPVFLGDPRQQTLTDPQSLNSYSYANDNPVTKSDPTGKCIYDGCVVEGVAALGFAGGVAAQAFHDYSTGDFSRRSAGQNVATYLTAGGAGAVVAGATAVAGVETVGLGLVARFGVAGLTSGALTAVTEIGANNLLRQPTDGGSVLSDSIVNGLGSGILTFLPGVPGALPKTISSALSVFSKAHAARSGAEALFGTSLQMLGTAGYQFYSSSSGGAGSASKSGGGNQGSKSQNGTSVSSWMGSFNPFSPR